MLRRRNPIVHGLILIALTLYTIYAAGPFVWVASMSLKTTTEITSNRYGWPETLHFWKYLKVWTEANYQTYFYNSTLVVFSAVIALTIIGGMAAHCLARYRFTGNRVIFFIIFSSIILPPQILMISLFQVLVQMGLYNSLLGLTLVYISLQMPLTVFLLEGFFRQIPQDLYNAAKIDGYSEFEIFWRITLPIGMPAIATTVIINFIALWNEFLFAVVLISVDEKRTLPLGIQKFMGDQLEDIGMIATGMMISVIPIIVIYVFFSEKLIQGMTAGAVK